MKGRVKRRWGTETEARYREKITFPKDQVRGARTRSLPLPQPALASAPPAAPKIMVFLLHLNTKQRLGIRS